MNLFADPGHEAPKDFRIFLVRHLQPPPARRPPEAPDQFGPLRLRQRPRRNDFRAHDARAFPVQPVEFVQDLPWDWVI